MKVSCVMPTRGRPEFAVQALQSFMSQDYPEKELIILDDDDAPSFMSLPAGTGGNVHYHRGPKLTIGAKRNLLARFATGELICHFDDDDWSAPGRISHQVKLIEQSEKAVSAFHNLLFYGPSGRVSKHMGYPGGTNLGSSYLYRKGYWERHRFPEGRYRPPLTAAEDSRFLYDAHSENQLISTDGERYLVARIHAGNTSEKYPERYRQMTVPDLPEGFPR